MRFLKALFAPKEVRAALGVLDEADHTFCRGDVFRPAAFDLVRPYVERRILARPRVFAQSVRRASRSPREYVYSYIANTAGDLVESGEYHVYRGYLDPNGPGNDLYALFCEALDELVRIGAMDSDYAKEQKGMLAKGVGEVG